MTAAIPTGWMDRQITLQSRAVTKDGATNADIVSWSDAVSPEWACVRESAMPAPTGGEAAVAAAGYARPSEIWIQWRAGFDKSATRIKLDGRILRITGSADVGRQDKIKLAVQEWAHE